MAVPLLPVETFIRYAARLGIENLKEERHVMGRLPQFYADMFGWRNMAVQVAAVYHGLPPEDQAHAVIFAYNYGDAGAIDYYGPGLGLPNAISGHNNYYLWVPAQWIRKWRLSLEAAAQLPAQSSATCAPPAISRT